LSGIETRAKQHLSVVIRDCFQQLKQHLALFSAVVTMPFPVRLPAALNSTPPSNLLPPTLQSQETRRENQLTKCLFRLLSARLRLRPSPRTRAPTARSKLLQLPNVTGYQHGLRHQRQ
jgi:hypothetical protein